MNTTLKFQWLHVVDINLGKITPPATEIIARGIKRGWQKWFGLDYVQAGKATLAVNGEVQNKNTLSSLKLNLLFQKKTSYLELGIKLRSPEVIYQPDHNNLAFIHVRKTCWLKNSNVALHEHEYICPIKLVRLVSSTFRGSADRQEWFIRKSNQIKRDSFHLMLNVANLQLQNYLLLTQLSSVSSQLQAARTEILIRARYELPIPSHWSSACWCQRCSRGES